jgi:hypothetical protein
LFNLHNNQSNNTPNIRSLYLSRNQCKGLSRLINRGGTNLFNQRFAQVYYAEAAALDLTHIGDIAQFVAVKILVDYSSSMNFPLSKI